MQIFYHGSSVLFPKFDLSHALEGDGKAKFGFGVYLTSSFKSAAHYSETKSRPATNHYVYTVEVPDFTEDNHIDFKKPVHPDIIKRAEKELGHSIPDKYTLYGSDFRKYLAKELGGGSDIQFINRGSELRERQTACAERSVVTSKSGARCRKAKLNPQSEKLASGFLNKIGVEFLTWPYNWKNPDLGLNVAVLDDNKIKITKIHQVELDRKKQLIKGSEKEIFL